MADSTISGFAGKSSTTNVPRFKALGKVLAPWALPIALLIAWEIAARTGLITARLMPAPSTVAAAFWKSLLDGTLIYHTYI